LIRASKHLLVVSADTSTRNGFTRTVGGALSITGTEGGFVRGWGTDQSTVFGTTGTALKGTLGFGRDTGGDVFGAEDTKSTFGGAESTANAGDGDVHFIGFAGTLVWITVVGLAGGSWGGSWGRAGGRSGGRSGAWAWGRSGGGGFGTRWVRGRLRDTAHVLWLGGGSFGQQNVTVQSPSGTPGIFHFPVRGVAQSTVSNGQDTVVEGGTASGVVKDTGFVKLKRTFVGFNGDGDGADGNGGGQRIFVHFGDIGVSGDGDGGFAACCAGTGHTLVRVVGFGTDTTVTLDVGKGIVHETTVATLVAFGVAGDKHLFGQGHEFAGGNGVSTFGGTGGGKGPAGTALALVFNGCDGVLFGPING